MQLTRLIVLLFLAKISAETDSCITFKGTKGTCVNIKQCPFLLNLLLRRKLLPANALRRLNQSQCGFERLDPKVCCNSELSDTDESASLQSSASAHSASNDFSKHNACRTASGVAGTCISVHECPSLYEILSEKSVSGVVLQILKQSLCGFEKMMPKVCCGDYPRSSGSSTLSSPQTHLQIPANHSKRDRCVTPRGADGTCVNIKQCMPMFTLLKRSNQLSYEASQALKAVHCGFEKMDPKVCCENEQPTTPSTQQVSDDEHIPPPPDVSNHPNLGLLEHDLCGPIHEAKIIGGTKTAVFEFPWMALIAYDTGSGLLEFRCGGSLITGKHVLTAAHCITTLPPDLRLVGVRLGEHDLSKERDCDSDEDGSELNCAEDYQDFSIIGIAVHPGYPKDTHQDDIALIMLDGEANFLAANVRPICLPVGLRSVLNPKMTVTGWGATESGPRSQTLRKVTLPIVSHKECVRLYKMRNIQIWYKQICAGGFNRTDSCSGDSGGPLQALGMYNREPRNILYGVVSFGPRDCGREGVPGVYTKVEYYMNWILDTIGTEIYD